MEPKTQKAVLAVLRWSMFNGFAQQTSSYSTKTGLPRWKRFLNWTMRKLGANQSPFIDPCNYTKVDVVPLSQVADSTEIDKAMRILAPEPTCCVCGGKDLEPDPGGYCCHAVRYDGAPLLCRNLGHN